MDWRLGYVARGTFLYEDELAPLGGLQKRVRRDEVETLLAAWTSEKPHAACYVSGSARFVEACSRAKLKALGISEVRPHIQSFRMKSPAALVDPPGRETPGRRLLVLLHGFGGNEEGLVLAADRTSTPNTPWSSLRAPLGMGPGSYAWFPLAFSEEGPVVLDPAQAETSRELIIRIVRWSHAELGTDAARTVLVGFSQGAILGAAVALTEPGLVKAAVLHSGRVLPESLEHAVPSANPPRYLVLHGLYDPVLPVANGRATNDALTSLGLKPEYHEFAIAHQISDESLDLATNWIRHL